MADGVAVFLLVLPGDFALAVDGTVAVVDCPAADVGLELELGDTELLDEDLPLFDDFVAIKRSKSQDLSNGEDDANDSLVALALGPLPGSIFVLIHKRLVIVFRLLLARLIVEHIVLSIFRLLELKAGDDLTAKIRNEALSRHTVRDVLCILGECDFGAHDGVQQRSEDLPDSGKDPGCVVDVEDAERFGVEGFEALDDEQDTVPVHVLKKREEQSETSEQDVCIEMRCSP